MNARASVTALVWVPLVWVALVWAAGCETSEPIPASEFLLPPTGQCPAADTPEGTAYGRVVPDMEVTQCDGTTVRLHQLLCGQKLSLLDLGAATYPLCLRATQNYVAGSDYKALKASGLGSVARRSAVHPPSSCQVGS